MSPIELQIIAQKDDIFVTVEKPPPVQLEAVSVPNLNVIVAGNIGATGPQGPPGAIGPQGIPGPEGPQGQWLSLTQAEYDALDPPDIDTLYVIVE